MNCRIVALLFVLLVGSGYGQQDAARVAVPEAGERSGAKLLRAALSQARKGPLVAVKQGGAAIERAARGGVSSGSATEAARQILEQGELTQFRDARVKFALREVADVLGMRVVKASVEVDGTPVRGKQLSFLFGRNQEMVAAFGGVMGRDVEVVREWMVSEEQAIARVKQDYVAVQGEPQATRYYEVVGERAEPRYDVLVRDVSGEWGVQVSAVTGEVLRVDSMRWGQTQGIAYASNPVKGQAAQVRLDNLTSNANLTGSQAKVYSYLPNLLFIAQPKIFAQVAQPTNGNYLYAPGDYRFSEVQLYHGMDRVASKFKELGFAGFGRPLEGVVYFKDAAQVEGQTVYTGQNNAYFSPLEFGGRGGLFFYLTQRGGDVAWDSDVIFHEYTHAVVSALVGNLQGPTFRAVNEGMADYFAASFLEDPAIAEWAARIFGLRVSALRMADNASTWPSNVVGQAHQDGNIWSGTMWEIRRALGAEKANRIALGALALMDGSEEFFDAALAVAVVAELLYKGTNSDAVLKILVERGVGDDDAATASESITLRPGVAGPQTTIRAASTVQILSAQQFRIDVPAWAEGLRVQVNANANVRYFLRYRAPITVEGGQVVADQLSSSAGIAVSGTISLENVPELQAGTYYIGVSNVSTQIVNYTVTATILGSGSGAGPSRTLVTSGQRAPGSVPAGPWLASRQFMVDVPVGSTGLTVALAGDKDVDLYVTRESAVTLNSQGLPQADYFSASATGNETVTINGRSLPGGLAPGRYYIGVFNYSRATSSFTVTATVTNAVIPPTVVQTATVENTASITAPSFAASPGVGSLVPTQVSFTLPPDAAAIKIAVTTLLEVDLIVKLGSAYQQGGSFEHFFTPTGTQTEFEISTASNPALQPGGTYYIAVGNYSPNGGPVAIKVSVTRRQAVGGQISAAGIVSATSYQGGGVAPGEIVTLFGTGIGPTTLTGLRVDNGKLATTVGQTRVLFDGVAAPIIYSSAGQVSCIAPYAIAGKANVTVVVEYQGVNSNSATVPVQAARPALFTANASGSGPAAMLNQDSSVNTAANPAEKGSIVVLYATGEGVTTPGGVDGQIANAVYPKPVAAVSVSIGGMPAEVLYAGAAPGLVAGVMQVNVRVPEGLVGTGAVPVQVTVGGAVSRTGVTLAVK